MFLPLMVIRMSEDISAHSLAILIEASAAEERPSFWRQLLIDTAVGLALGLVSGLIAFGLLEALGAPLESAAGVSVALALTVILVAAASAAVPYLALKPDGSGWRAPSVFSSPPPAQRRDRDLISGWSRCCRTQ